MGLSIEAIEKQLTKESGLLGLSGGLSNDCRDLEEAAEKGFRRLYAKTATRMPLAITLFQKENFTVVPAPFKAETKNHNFIWFVKEI